MNTKKDAKGSVIIFGLDDEPKPRAARYLEKDAQAAVKIAQQLHLNVWKVTTTTLPDLVSKAPFGNPATIGWAACPKVPREVWEAVLQAATLDNPARKETVPTIEEQDKASVKGLKPADLSELERQIIAVAHERQIDRLPDNWSSIKEGSVVLVQQNRDDGWWEGYVLKRQGNMLTLRWRDFPRQPTIVRHLSTVALMDPRAN
jgi:hypothetical protein